MLSDIHDEVSWLENEVAAVYSVLVLPHWGKGLHGFPETLYGYMMRIFALVDLLSAHWKGNDKDQTNRMAAFMNQYMRSNHEANSVSVQMWRHKLMHTAQPRPLRDSKTGITYRWLLHWHEHLPRDQHYTFSDSIDMRILNVSLVCLIGDLKQGAVNYERDLLASVELQGKFSHFQQELGAYEYRDIAP